MTFPFKQIFNDSLKTSFHKRMLWVFGIFISSVGLVYQYSPEDSNQFLEIVRNGTKTGSLTDLYKSVPVLTVLIVLGLVMLFFMVFSFVCKIGLIQSIKDEKDQKKIKFWQNIKLGFRKFWKILLLEIILLVPAVVMLAVLFLSYKFEWTAWLNVVLMVLMFLYLIFTLLFNNFSYCYLILDGESPWQAVKSGLRLFLSNWKETALVNLIRIGMNLVFWVLNFVVAIVIALPFVLLAALFILFTHWSLPFVMLVIGAVCFIVALIAVKGFKSAFTYVLLTKTYWELRK